MERGDLERVDRETFRLARGQGRIRLQMGAGLARLVQHGWHRELGFSSVAAYSYERLSRSGRTVSEMRVVARRLGELPVARRALTTGRIGWSTAEVLARHATPETEGELVELARGLSVRALRAALKERAREAGTRADASGNSGTTTLTTAGAESDPEPLCTLTVTVPVEDVGTLEVTRVLAEHLTSGWTGPGAADRWLEVLLAEGQGSLMNVAPPRSDVACEDLVDDLELLRAEREASMERRARAEERAEGRVVGRQEVEAGEAPEEEPLPGDAVGMDRFLRQRSMELAGRELWLGKMLARFFAADGWRRLGYATDTQYARERLGMSRAAAYKMMRLARRTRRFERIADAVGNGHLGMEAALLLVRVVRPETEEAWVERARARTYKQLKEEVEQVEMGLRLLGSGADGGPPTGEAIAEHQGLMRDILTGTLVRRALGMAGTGGGGQAGPGDVPASVASADEALAARSDDAAAAPGDVPVCVASADEALAAGSDDAAAAHRDAPVQMSAVVAQGRDAGALARLRLARLGNATVRWRVTPETALFFRQLEQAYMGAGGEPDGFVRFLCVSFWKTWVHHLGKSDRWEAIYARELYRCSSPVCFRRDCTGHHIQFRSQGGTDEDENMAAPCGECHLFGIHEGRIRLYGPASRMRWLIGRAPILEVDGREKRLLT